MRAAILKVHLPTLKHLLGLPEEVDIVAAAVPQNEPLAGEVHLLVMSPAFGEVQPGHVYPNIDATYRDDGHGRPQFVEFKE